MQPLEKILQNASGFLDDVAGISSKWVQNLQVERSREIVNYHPLRGGHMLRPLLVYITSGALDEKIRYDQNTNLVHFAAAVELMHNASLLHDDLLDQEEIRRGKPCVSKRFGFKNALLCGNIYYIRAIELSNAKLESRQTTDILQAAIAMCEGEILQAAYEKEKMPYQVYDRIIRYKTGSLMALACRQAAAIMQEDEDAITLFGELGEEIGVLYQLRDDLKDRDVLLDTGFTYADRIERCNRRLQELITELSKSRRMEQFEELIDYFKESK